MQRPGRLARVARRLWAHGKHPPAPEIFFALFRGKTGLVVRLRRSRSKFTLSHNFELPIFVCDQQMPRNQAVPTISRHPLSGMPPLGNSSVVKTPDSWGVKTKSYCGCRRSSAGSRTNPAVAIIKLGAFELQNESGIQISSHDHRCPAPSQPAEARDSRQGQCARQTVCGGFRNRIEVGYRDIGQIDRRVFLHVDRSREIIDPESANAEIIK